MKSTKKNKFVRKREGGGEGIYNKEEEEEEEGEGSIVIKQQ